MIPLTHTDTPVFTLIHTLLIRIKNHSQKQPQRHQCYSNPWDQNQFSNQSQIFTSSSSSVFPAISLGFSIFGEIFVWLFFQSNHRGSYIRGWCMLGVILLLAFTRLGHECQDLLSLCHERYVCRLDLSLYSHLKELQGIKSELMLTPCEKSLSTGSLWGRSNLPCSIMQDSKPNTQMTELFWPCNI